MADPNGNGANVGDSAPQLNILAQYTKDLSFENPNAPRSLAPQEKGPNISIQVNVNARQLADTDFEVSLVLEGQAGDGSNVLFKFELDYAGVFRIRNVSPQSLPLVLMIECPRLLFPFTRQIIAEAVGNGGFLPFLMGPIDFTALYQQRLAQGQTDPAVLAT